LGELRVLQFERDKLFQIGFPELAKRVVHEEAEGNRPGWDISSFDENQQPICIEVKSSIGKINQLEITYNEWEAAKRKGDTYFIYLVQNLTEHGPLKIELIKDPVRYVNQKEFCIKTVSYNLKLSREWMEKH